MKIIAEQSSKFYTDGVKTIKVRPGETPPEGFRPGRTFNVNPWNKGHTKESDPRVADNVAKMRETRIERDNFQSWNKGQTKDTDDRLKMVSQKISVAKKGQSPYNKGKPASEHQKQAQSSAMKGRTPWNKGLTKETNDSLMSASKKLMGHTCFVTNWELAKQKEYETKKRNHSFNSSRPEQELIAELIQEYGEEDIIHPYKDERYPFNCDVYIRSIDLFIELNGTIEHNGRPYDPSNPEHVREAIAIEDRARELGPKSRYWNVLKWWTEIDPKKLETFRRNNLNFRIIYPNGLVIEK